MLLITRYMTHGESAFCLKVDMSSYLNGLARIAYCGEIVNMIWGRIHLAYVELSTLHGSSVLYD